MPWIKIITWSVWLESFSGLNHPDDLFQSRIIKTHYKVKGKSCKQYQVHYTKLTGILDVFASFVWFRSAFIRDDFPTLVLPIKATLRNNEQNSSYIQTRWVGLVVRAIVFHQCGPGLISTLGVICGLSLLVLYSALRSFPWVLWLSPHTKNHLIWYVVISVCFI